MTTIDDQSYSLLVKQRRQARAALYACLLTTGLLIVALTVVMIVAIPVGHYILGNGDMHSNFSDFMLGIMVLIAVTFTVLIIYGIIYGFYCAFIVTLPDKNDKDYKLWLERQQNGRNVYIAFSIVGGFGIFSYYFVVFILSTFTSNASICTNNKFTCALFGAIALLLMLLAICIILAILNLTITTIYNAFSSLPIPNRHKN